MMVYTFISCLKMQKLSKKETLLHEKDEAERAEHYAQKQRRQYRLRFGSLMPLLIAITKYIVIVRAVLAVFWGGYILWQLQKECGKCSITVLPCEIPKTGATI